MYLYVIFNKWRHGDVIIICVTHHMSPEKGWMFSRVTKLLFSFLKLPNRPISRFCNRNIFLWLLQLVRLRNKFLIFHNFRQKNPKCQFSTKIWKNVFWRKIWKNDDFWKIKILFWRWTVLYRATNLQRLKPSNSKKLKIYLLLKTKFGATYDRYLSFSYGCPDRPSLQTVSGLVRTTIKGFYI